MNGVRQIAELAHVSIGTVDRALHNRPGVSEATRKRVLWIAKRLGYRPNLVARTLSVARKGFLIGVCIPREIHFFYDQLLHGILSEAKHFEHFGVKVLYHPVNGLEVDSSKEIHELLRAGINGLLVTPGDPEKLAPVIDDAEKRNVRVVCVASDNPISHRSSFVTVNSAASGHLAAELMGKGWIPKSQVAVITGSLQTIDHRKKTEGFLSHFPRFCPGGKVIGVVEGHGDEDETFQKCYDLIRKNANLAGLYVNTANCLPVCRALGASGLAGKVRLVTTDLFEEMVPFFNRGTIFASIYQRPYTQGRRAVQIMAEHLISSRPFPKAELLSPVVVMCSNLSLFHAIRQRPHKSRLEQSGPANEEVSRSQPTFDF